MSYGMNLAKRRPASAETNQQKTTKLDLEKMHASLKLLRKSIQKSSRSNLIGDHKNDIADDRSDELVMKEVSAKICQEVQNKFKRTETKKTHMRKKTSKCSGYHDKDSHNNSTQVLMQSPKANRGEQTSPNISKLRRVFGSEKMVREHSRRNNNEMLSESMISDKFESSKIHPPIDTSRIEKSIFERSAFDDFSFKKFQEFYKDQIMEFRMISEYVEKEGKDKKAKAHNLLQENKISSNSFDRKVNGIEKWISSRKKEIKKKKKSFIQLLGNIQKQQSEFQLLRRKIQSPDQALLDIRNHTPSIAIDTSVNSVNRDKCEPSDYRVDKDITPLRISTSRLKASEYLGNSNLSLLNSGINNSKFTSSVQKAKDANVSMNTSK